jgi:uncharacterized protein (DUF302 family)
MNDATGMPESGEAMEYHLSKFVGMTYDEAVARVTEELANEGFGILTEIDVKATLKKKLDADFRSYIILGACNPPFAYKALQAEDKIGALLPCNVIVQEHTDGRVEVSAMNPGMMSSVVDNPKLTEIASQVEATMRRVLERL